MDRQDSQELLSSQPTSRAFEFENSLEKQTVLTRFAHLVGEASGRYKALETTTQIPAGRCDRARLLHLHLSAPAGVEASCNLPLTHPNIAGLGVPDVSLLRTRPLTPIHHITTDTGFCEPSWYHLGAIACLLR
jgi:hypothetical protein